MRRSASYSTTPPIPGGIYAPLIHGQLSALQTEYPHLAPIEALRAEFFWGNLTLEQGKALATVLGWNL